MICPKCNNQIPDDSKFCPVCGSPIEAPFQNQQNVNEYSQQQQASYQQPPYTEQPDFSAQNTQNQYSQQNGAYQQNQYSQPNQNYNYQNYNNYNQPNTPPYGPPFGMNDEIIHKGENAKTLGIVALIVGLFVPLVGWICGGIGMSNANAAFNMTGNIDFKNSKTICLVALITSSVSFLFAFIKMFSYFGVYY